MFSFICSIISICCNIQLFLMICPVAMHMEDNDHQITFCKYSWARLTVSRLNSIETFSSKDPMYPWRCHAPHHEKKLSQSQHNVSFFFSMHKMSRDKKTSSRSWSFLEQVFFPILIKQWFLFDKQLPSEKTGTSDQFSSLTYQ